MSYILGGPHHHHPPTRMHGDLKCCPIMYLHKLARVETREQWVIRSGFISLAHQRTLEPGQISISRVHARQYCSLVRVRDLSKWPLVFRVDEMLRFRIKTQKEVTCPGVWASASKTEGALFEHM